MNTANQLAVGIIALAILAVLVGGNGGTSLVKLFGSALQWSAGLFTQLTGK
jgi:uncharacterized integral membrane protein